MKHYVPDLIPTQHRVLPDYFKPTPPPTASPASSPTSLLRKCGVVAVLVVALLVVGIYPGFSFSLLTLAFFLSERGRRRLEQGLRFHFTPSLRAGTLGFLSLTSVVTGVQYKHRLDGLRETARLAVLAEEKAQAETKRKETLRLDSLRTHLSLADALMSKGAYGKAISLYNQSARYASSNEAVEQSRLHTGLATGYAHTKQYRLAIQEYDWLSPLDEEQLYQRALCYQQLGEKGKAMADLHKASEAGYKPATKLYDKLNPLVRKLMYYQTVCCDGSYSPSNAKGRGACSHHGGVCNWNYPIYETYRKYNDNGFPE
jgi:tetratricopeptide (TPR) repeat protein